jgi:hypothetical protein
MSDNRYYVNRLGWLGLRSAFAFRLLVFPRRIEIDFDDVSLVANVSDIDWLNKFAGAHRF